MGACLVTQPKKLGDKKSSFLRALRRETSEPNAGTPSETSLVSPPLTITTDTNDKQVVLASDYLLQLNIAHGDGSSLLVLCENAAVISCCVL